MIIRNLWHFVCLVLGFHSLNTLIEESHEVVYKKRNETQPVQHLFCEELSWFFPEQTQIDLKELRDGLYEISNDQMIIARELNRNSKNKF